MARQFIAGTLVRPALITKARGQEKVSSLACQLSLEWIDAHLEQRATCLVEEGKVTQIQQGTPCLACPSPFKSPPGIS